MTRHDVLVIGAGMSGIGAAIRLRQEGITDFAVLEKAATLGGTWRDNTYPGCACDVPSALYSYSFAPNPEWRHAFARQPEIRDYLADTARRFGVVPHIRFGTEVVRAQWHDREQRWALATTAGDYTARIVVAGTGPWHEPRVPDLPGLDRFAGEMFHSARWNHDYDLSGKRVAVLGTGASAVQFVPAIQPEVGRLHLFQRTAQWVLPKPDHPVHRLERALLRRLPVTQRALRALEYVGMEALGVGFRHPWLLRQVQRIGLAHLRKTVRDPALRRMLTQSNVELHPTAVASVGEHTVTGVDGATATVDAIIFGTGFHILDMPVADRVFDASGRSLADHWQGSPQAYLGTVVSGFPNAFVLLGPSLGTGHSSASTILEAQLRFTIAGIKRILTTGWSSVDVRREVQDTFNAELQRALPRTVYNSGGCSSYYLDVNGRNSFSWPWSTGRLRRRVGEFDVSAFHVTERVRDAVPAS